MEKVEICRKTLQFNSNCKRTLVYCMTVDELSDITAGICLENYGVNISIAESGEQSTVQRITFSQRRIIDLISTLAKCEVTPISLFDIVCDWLCT